MGIIWGGKYSSRRSSLWSIKSSCHRFYVGAFQYLTRPANTSRCREHSSRFYNYR